MNEKDMRAGLESLRIQWRNARGYKLSRKRELMNQGGDVAAVRHDRVYRIYRKAQRHFARLVRHMESRLNRKRARSENKN
jgi:hypothetical protein